MGFWKFIWTKFKQKKNKDTSCKTSQENRKMTDGILKIRLYLEKISDKGEDAEPILLCRDKSGLISVFDGLGGAGSTVYEEKGGARYTGARYASQLAKTIVENYFTSRLDNESEENQEANLLKNLKTELKSGFEQKADELGNNSSKLKGPMIKRLPTTMAAIYFWQNTENPQEYKCCPIWAGDSRCYVLNTSNGLQQLTQDELKSAGDALENLRDDSPLSNYINADVDFNLCSRTISVKFPCVFLVATDGCFGYLSTPMHFEFLLLRTLQDSEDEKQWEEILTGELQQIAGDDVSMALIAIGWEDFNTFKQNFKCRLDSIDNDYISQLDKLTQEIETRTQKIETLTQEKEECVNKEQSFVRNFGKNINQLMKSQRKQIYSKLARKWYEKRGCH